MATVVIHTTAEPAYDYPYCTRTETDMYLARGNRYIMIYRVEIPEESVDYQSRRYESGLNPTWTESELEAELQTTYTNVGYWSNL